MRVLIFQRIIPHYRIPIFKALSKHFDLIVCHGKEHKRSFLKDHSGDIGFKHCQIKNFYLSRTNDTLVFQNIFMPLIKYHPDVVILEFSLGILSNLLIFFLRKFLKYKLILWSHGYNRKKGFHPNKSIVDKIRLKLINLADGMILYSNEGKKVLSRWVNPEKLYVAPNTLDTVSLIKIRKKCEEIGREVIKKKWGLQYSKIIIFIGRLIKEKRVDCLLQVFSEVKKKFKDCCLIVIGDGPEKSYLKTLVQDLNLNDVFFFGEIYDSEKTGELLFISDILVNPGYVGLSVVHALCFDTPVITLTEDGNKLFHGPEIEYIENAKTGFVASNINEMIDKILLIITDEKILRDLKLSIRKIVKRKLGIEKMINTFREIIEHNIK